MQETRVCSSTGSENIFSTVDRLPLQLIKSEVIPPAPQSDSSIDWLPDFAGYSWIAYGASSLFVISHFPNPLSDEETLLGPIFRQVFELSVSGTGSISTVSWSPVTPSVGEIAAALDNCICLFSFSSDTGQSSFCWSQTTTLLQSTNVEAISWMGSGEGLISAGSDVILWRRKDTSWCITWKFQPELPQVRASATWSIEGPFATAPSNPQKNVPSFSCTASSRCVLVFLSDVKVNYMKIELYHPLPVSMIQWRPLTRKESKTDDRCLSRQVLLTCCMDGTVRLWSEAGDGRSKRIGKEHDKKSIKRSFHVVGIIEVNQELNGILGSDTFVKWAIVIDGTINAGVVGKQYSSGNGSQHNKDGRCEWLIGFGPQMMVTLWSIHCLDDFTPVRFPRVNLWKTQELMGPGGGVGSKLLDKVVILQNEVFGPPNICSLVRSLPCNSLAWSQLYNQSSNDGSLSLRREDILSCYSGGVLNVDGHTGKILQVAVNHFGFDVEGAVSLDTDGLLFFWSFSTFSHCIAGMPTMYPTLKLTGKLLLQDFCSNFTTLNWAPTVLGEHLVLLVGHVGGVDCLLIKFDGGEENNILCHKLCTIPFASNGCLEGPVSIFTIPSPSSSKETVLSNTFMMLAIWKDAFQALSWKVAIHLCDFPQSCCVCDLGKDAAGGLTFRNEFDTNKYCINVYLCSSVFPDTHHHDQVTSFAVVCPTYVISGGEESFSVNDMSGGCSAYQLVTGYANGTLKLWRSMPAKQSKSTSHWELVGVLTTFQGPIVALSITGSGRKIATICLDEHSNASTLHIWEAIKINSTVGYVLEDTIHLDGKVAALNWLVTGGGEPLLGVCLENQLQVYIRRRCGGHNLLKSGKPSEKNIWFCIAFSHTYSTIHNFFWGPRATAVVVHDNYFTLFSQWLCFTPKNCHAGFPLQGCKDFDCGNELAKNLYTTLCFGTDTSCFKDPMKAASDMKCSQKPSVKMKIKNDALPIMPVTCSEEKQNSSTRFSFWNILEVFDYLCGSLPIYHPEALLTNMYSGKWERACVAIRHLVEHLSSKASSIGSQCATSNHIIPSVGLSNYLEALISSSSSGTAFQWGSGASVTTSFKLQEDSSHDAFSLGFDSPNATFTSSSTRSELNNFTEPLESNDIAAITNTEKMQILTIVDLLQEVNNPNSSSAYKSLDDPGRRFWVAVKFQQLYFIRRFGKEPSAQELVVDSALVGWAFHSDCQEALFNSLLSSDPSWEEMRSLGVGFWYTNDAQLRMKMEKLARQQYLKNRDPKACALLYIALNRIQVLAGLFKISKDEKDKPLVAFLLRNFQEERNREAALKNAYVLLGRHQLELATAFFLLGGDVTSAISVCAKNLGDEQLALIICRLVEGYGGPLEHHLISKFLLPSANERGDHCFASYLEWVLGNPAKAFLSMMGVNVDSLASGSAVSSNHTSFLDPSAGHYCQILANKNGMKKAVGEHTASILSRWATLMEAASLNRCGLPLEALEYFSSSMGHFGLPDEGSVSDILITNFLSKMLISSPDCSSLNSISSDVASHTELHAKLDIAMCYITKILREHPCWLQRSMEISGGCTYPAYDIHPKKESLEHFHQKLFMGISYFERNFFLQSAHLIDMVVIFLCNNGLLYIAYNILCCYASKYQLIQQRDAFESSLSKHVLPNLLLNAIEEIPWLFSRFVVISSIISSQMKSYSSEISVNVESKSMMLAAWGFHVQGLIWCLHGLRAALKLHSDSFSETSSEIPFIILDLCEYCVYFASTWLQSNYKALVSIVKPLLNVTNGHAPHEISITDLSKHLSEVAESFSLSNDSENAVQANNLFSNALGNDMMSSVPNKERWHIVEASLWEHVSSCMQYAIDSLPEKFKEDYPIFQQSKLHTFVSNFYRFRFDDNILLRQLDLVPFSFCKLLKTVCVHMSSVRAKQLALFLWWNVEILVSTPSLSWLKNFIVSQTKAHKKYCQFDDSRSIMNNENILASEMLLDIFADSEIMNKAFVEETIKCLQLIRRKHLIGWNDMYQKIIEEHETDSSAYDQRQRAGGAGEETSSGGNSVVSLETNDRTQTKKIMPFKASKDIYKRSGELLEALCINSINQSQAAIASNRKGIIFFDLESTPAYKYKSNYLWAEADWPPKQWAGSESSPAPTCVSPGVRLKGKQESNHGFRGATVGPRSLARPGRDLTGGAAFGLPGYAGVGASGLGWEMQEDFKEFANQTPATAEKISTGALSSHPYRPFFLVGSSNTHIFLWEFGKHEATASYGVLPAANGPPSNSISSISTVQFDQYGQRFVSAALDGTICTWQLEVGGRINNCPTDSSLCFNHQAWDVTYVSSSGSIIAAAGYSSNDVNVIIWDTLAPAATSRASIICHEGGARSLSVFDNDIGSGSISPLIVTGGKDGDIALHDFRYVATGKTKKNRNSDCSEQINVSAMDAQGIIGDPTASGMLWYIPKAHSGSVTKISTVPNTSFFLTGGKDGDVKLWDAKRAKLVFHWPKLHERHIFLQPRSRGFGTVVRAAVTDIQVVSNGFLTCGGDGSVKFVGLKDSLAEYTNR